MENHPKCTLGFLKQGSPTIGFNPFDSHLKGFYSLSGLHPPHLKRTKKANNEKCWGCLQVRYRPLQNVLASLLSWLLLSLKATQKRAPSKDAPTCQCEALCKGPFLHMNQGSSNHPHHTSPSEINFPVSHSWEFFTFRTTTSRVSSSVDIALFDLVAELQFQRSLGHEAAPNNCQRLTNHRKKGRKSGSAQTS